MADGFATTCAMSTYHHYYNCEFAGVLDVIKFVSDLLQVDDFLWVLRFSSIKADSRIITELLMRVVLNTISLPLPFPLLHI
jgi:hypothetical protein